MGPNKYPRDIRCITGVDDFSRPPIPKGFSHHFPYDLRLCFPFEPWSPLHVLVRGSPCFVRDPSPWPTWTERCWWPRNFSYTSLRRQPEGGKMERGCMFCKQLCGRFWSCTFLKFNECPMKIGLLPQTERIVFQPSFFRGELLNFGDASWHVSSLSVFVYDRQFRNFKILRFVAKVVSTHLFWNTPLNATFTKRQQFGISFIIGVAGGLPQKRVRALSGCVETTH